MSDPITIAISNYSAAIPIQLTTLSQTNWSQFAISIIFASLITVYVFWKLVFANRASPIMALYFWYYKKKVRRNLIAIINTSEGFFSFDMITTATYQKLASVLQKLNGRPVDILLHTPGGDMFAAMMISRLLKAYPGEKRAIIPGYAMSAGTVVALSCDKIHMNNSSSLGPVDAQVGMLWKYGPVSAWDKLVRFKGKKINDDSFLINHIAKQANRETKDFMTPLILGHTNNVSCVEDFIKGDLMHAHQFTKYDLERMGFKIGSIPNWVNKLLFKLIAMEK